MSARRVRGNAEPRKVEMMMTPMIDIVFQLLIFFLLTFKIVVPEGDFDVKLPQAAPPRTVTDDLPTFIHVKLTATSTGELAGVRVGDVELAPPFDVSLRRHVRRFTDGAGSPSGPGSKAGPEVEFDCDYQLHYQHAMMAITAVSGYLTPERNIVKLIEKVKFAPPSNSAERRGG